MTHLAIRVDNLGKQYQLGLREQGYRTFREAIVDAAAAPLRRFRHLSGSSREVERIWALKDVSFEVEPGEVVGIIGRNGAGKTTLLKILTRITEPTTGRAEIRGHVGSLLEVGTGMHPELTGRENIFLNGAIFGMPRASIKRRFDEIVDFSGVEKFLDTPVKRFSSGMRVRLAFAVAAHLEPEILLIDEVLAVGDAEFQKKCLGKMGDVASGGRTVLFVSHNMGAIRSLCKGCHWIEKGRIALSGGTEEVVASYMDYCTNNTTDVDLSIVAAETGDDVLINSEPHHGNITIDCGDPLTMEFSVKSTRLHERITIGICIDSVALGRVVSMSSLVQNVPCEPGPAKKWTVRCDMGTLPLNAGQYHTLVYLSDERQVNTRFLHAQTIVVREKDVFGWGDRLPPIRAWGPLYWAPEWRIQPCEANEKKLDH